MKKFNHQMQLRCLLSCGMWAVALVTAGALPSAAEEPPRPNVVIILVADLRWDELGCGGHPFVKTPAIDRLAHQGARFTNVFAGTPLCSPSRANFLTGLHAHSHGIIDNTQRDKQSHALVTFPRLLQASGYQTAFIGKWHMGNDDAPRPGWYNRSRPSIDLSNRHRTDHGIPP